MLFHKDAHNVKLHNAYISILFKYKLNIKLQFYEKYIFLLLFLFT